MPRPQYADGVDDREAAQTPGTRPELGGRSLARRDAAVARRFVTGATDAEGDPERAIADTASDNPGVLVEWERRLGINVISPYAIGSFL